MIDMKEITVGVIGGGVVGSATARTWLEHAKEVRVHDSMRERSTHTLVEVLEADVIFVCLPTPQTEGKFGLDISAVTYFFSQEKVTARMSGRLFVLRSTVPVGTTSTLRNAYKGMGLDIIHSPEFLTARCAQVDAQIPSRNVVGIPGYSSHITTLLTMYSMRFPGVQIHTLTSDESEAVKLFQNGFFAVKVAYWNEIQDLCRERGLSMTKVMNAILSDGRISPSHTQVPGSDGKFGFGGTCLPKDLSEVVVMSALNDDGFSVTEAALRRNFHDRQRSK